MTRERDVSARAPGDGRPPRDRSAAPRVARCRRPWPSRATPRRRRRPRRAGASTGRGRSGHRYPRVEGKPAPLARLRAKCRWIHESSSGNPGAPAMCHSRAEKSASGSRLAATTTRVSAPPCERRRRLTAAGTRGADGAARRLRADEGVVLVVDGLLAERQHVEIAAVRDLDLDEPSGRTVVGLQWSTNHTSRSTVDGRLISTSGIVDMVADSRDARKPGTRPPTWSSYTAYSGR